MGWYPQRNVNSWNYSRLFNALFSRVEKRKISAEIKWRIHWILIKLSRVLFTARSQSLSPFQINLWHGPSPFVRSSCALCAATIHVTKHRESVCVNSVQRRPHCTSHSAQYKWNIICHYSSSLSSLSGRLVIYIYTYIINGAHSITQFRPAPRPDLQQQKQQQNKEARRLLQLNPITKFTRSEHNFVNDFRLP